MTFSASIRLSRGSVAPMGPGRPPRGLEGPGHLEQAAALLVGLPQPAAQGSAEGPENLGGRFGVPFQEGGEGGFPDDEEGGAPVRHGGGGARGLVNERHLAAGAPGGQDRQDLLSR